MTKVAIPLLGLALGLWWAVAEGPLRDPKEALQDFYEAEERAEDQLMDPLILNGRRVVPLAIAEVPNKEMKHRRYAIGFLGNGQYRDALPVLEQILADETELYYFRVDALEGIFRISPVRARELASRHVKGKDLLGRIAQEIEAGGSPGSWARSYWQALLHVHE
jgi:nitrogen fixation-related uncharacterized protein